MEQWQWSHSIHQLSNDDSQQDLWSWLNKIVPATDCVKENSSRIMIQSCCRKCIVHVGVVHVHFP